MDARQELLKAKNTEGVEYAIYPYTTTKCVTNEDGENLDVILSKMSSGGYDVDLTNYYNKTEVDNLLADKADSNDIPSLEGYAKTTDIPSLEGYATESYVTTAISNAQLAGEEVDLSAYYNKTEVDALLKDKADSSDIPDVSGYATTTDLDKKVNIAQGTANANKILQVGSDGNITLADIPESEYADATTSASGLMSASDKTKLDAMPDFVTTNTDPGVGVTSTYEDGTFIFVVEQ